MIKLCKPLSSFRMRNSSSILIQLGSPSSEIAIPYTSPSPTCNIHQANSSTLGMVSLGTSIHYSRMFIHKCKTLHSFQNVAQRIIAVTIDSRLLCVITGSIYLKSPPRMTSFPPKAFRLSYMSWRWRSTASNAK